MRSEIVKILKEGGVGVLATDTLYGVVGSALNRKTAERIYEVRKRNPKKPCIILISSLRDPSKFGAKIDSQTKNILKKLWPGKVSVVLPCTQKRFAYLHRGTNSLAFRMPRAKKLREILRETGPLMAPSANPEGLAPASTIKEAWNYFGGNVDFYEGSGSRRGAASTLVAIRNGEVEVLREGAVDIPSRLNG